MFHNLKHAWRWLSIQAAILVGAIAAAGEYFPEFQQFLPDGWVKWAALGIVVARLIKQDVKK